MTLSKTKKQAKNRTSMKIPLDELHKTADEFRTASQETGLIMNRLDKVVRGLEESWDDAGKQVFYQYYKEWFAHIGGVSELLNVAANELDAIAERYSKANGDIPVPPDKIK